MALRTHNQRQDVLKRRVFRSRLHFAGKVVVSILLLWHLWAVAAWNLPQTSPLFANQTADGSLVRNYMVASGFMQGWGMFAPDPYSLDLFVEARIHYSDGTTRLWEFPRMAHMSKWERYGKERWRK